MNIAYHCSNSFANVVGTSITSLFENNRDMGQITVYIIENGISDSNKEKLQEIAEGYHRQIVFIPMPDINQSQRLGLKKVKERWIFDSYCRLFLDELLPESVERVLYLDGDVLVLDSLQELWSMDMQGRAAAAVTDSLSEAYYTLFGLNDRARYCNSGVILFDLKQWHRQNMGDKIRKYIADNHGYVFFMEQTTFNAVLQDEILQLHPRYNVFTMMQILSYSQLDTVRRSKRFYSEQEVQQALDKPCIVHMTSSFLTINRAWYENTDHPMQDTYVRYAMLTPWSDCPLQKDPRGGKRKLVDAVVHLIPYSILLPMVSVLYNKIRVAHIRKTGARCAGQK